jgi:hypothetical protein
MELYAPLETMIQSDKNTIHHATDSFKFIIYNPISELFTFYVNYLVIELNNRNIDTLIINEIKINQSKYRFNYKNDIILIIINPHYIFDYIDIKNEINFISANFAYKILYLSEPINFIIEKRVFTDLIKSINPYVLWTYTYENFLKINCHQKIFNVSPSYNTAYNLCDISIENLKNRNNSNILFIGNINENRKIITNTFSDYLISISNVWLKQEWATILNNNLFYLNIHRRVNCKSFESFRIIPILVNGGVIFSEHVNLVDEEKYKDYNIIFVNKEDLLNKFLAYKQNIDYNIIYEKTLLFRNQKNNNKELDKYLDYHSNFI